MKTGQNILCIIALFALFFPGYRITAQTITGAWKGKIKTTKVELKLIKFGDSLTGTSYYYDSKHNYRRYTVKGYFDPLTNQVVWWDDMLVKDDATGLFMRSLAPDALLSTANFNCPGEDKMLLDGVASLRDDKQIEKGQIHFQKISKPVFNDEWDYVIQNYTTGANNPYIIDSISQVVFLQSPPREPELPTPPGHEGIPAIINEPLIIEVNAPEEVINVEKKFLTRKKTLATVIPLIGDSIELRFYDNAEIDGDSIALFMNSALVFKNIRLTDQAYIVKFATTSLQNDNELVMVAENLGSIPPNTSLMVAIVGGKRYEARLQSTENSSALIRFIKPAPSN